MRRAVLFYLVVAGCQGGQPDRMELADQRVSIRELDGWSAHRDHGATVLQRNDDRVTIAIQASPLRASDHDESAADAVFHSAETIVRGLPEAKITGIEPLAQGQFEGRAFEVTFEPAGKREAYQRRHVVLVGQRVVHIMHTGPAGSLGATAELFDEVVASVREEI